MGEFISFIIAVAVIGSIISKVNKLNKGGKSFSDFDEDDGDVFSRTIIRTLQKRFDQNQKPDVNPQMLNNEDDLDEGKSEYVHVPIKPTVHEGEANDCEAHTLPNSSEGSSVRAHAKDSHGNIDCDAHLKDDSNKESYLDSLRSRKKEMTKKAIESEPNEQTETSEPIKVTKRATASGFNLNFSGKSAVNAVIYSEILGKPKSRR